jgi:hypothetical protein
VTILVDDREQLPLRFSAAVDVETVHLAVGDYSLRGATELVAIERKRLDELATCCGVERERFLEQVARLRGFPVRALVVEADLEGILGRRYASAIHPLSVLGTLIKFASDWQVPVWMAGDAANAALLVERTLLRVAKQRSSEACATPYDRILAALAKLGADESAVLALVAERLAMGRELYGELHVADDARDFAREALEEAADGLVYVAAALVKAGPAQRMKAELGESTNSRPEGRTVEPDQCDP